jgi:Ferritin-like domain
MTDISNDQVRRELREIDAVQNKIDRSWRSTLREMFDPERGAGDGDRARLLGVPDRRGVLRIGGVTIAGAALLAACGGDDSETPAAPVTTGAASGATAATGASGSGSLDLTLAKTAASLEFLAVATYQTAIGSGLVTTAAVGDAAKLFMSHHQAHLDALNALIVANGAAKIAAPNAAVKSAVVDPAVKAAKSEADIVAIAYTLEDAAAQTYVFATTQLSKPELRSTLMTIAGVEARHRAILAFLVQKKTPAEIFPAGFFKAENPLPAEALVK